MPVLPLTYKYESRRASLLRLSVSSDDVALRMIALRSVQFPCHWNSFKHLLGVRRVVYLVGQITAGVVQRPVNALLPMPASGHVVDNPPERHVSRSPFAAVAFLKFFESENARRCLGAAPFQTYLMKGPTNGDVSPRLKKWPDGPSPKNSENHDSCSTSSCKIAWERAYVLWSFPAVRLQIAV